MSEALMYTYPSPLEGFGNHPPLSDELNEDGKSYKNPTPTEPSAAYSSFTNPIDNGIRGGFDVHVYFQQQHEWELNFAKELWQRIRLEFPELRIYRVWDKPIGPHPIGSFEVNIHSPAQFGAFIPWLVINRGPLSALVHPNTGEEWRDHTQRASWLGPAIPLHLRLLKDLEQKKKTQQTL
ncbi:hypothetical protein K461DRAFT_274300 [Myriangium duriaei CBS 260.36]|uniref:Uncharacterized protein n=1 Tax=Myriangium duriaei CBS 260.36 TaxID=1168546 RepID=A0A9P4JAJ3_9PEZI|nr:hypothetical protein K461DRAFT_274300 [Myriangium duriaei CBS 260.36]